MRRSTRFLPTAALPAAALAVAAVAGVAPHASADPVPGTQVTIGDAGTAADTSPEGRFLQSIANAEMGVAQAGHYRDTARSGVDALWGRPVDSIAASELAGPGRAYHVADGMSRGALIAAAASEDAIDAVSESQRPAAQARIDEVRRQVGELQTSLSEVRQRLDDLGWTPA